MMASHDRIVGVARAIARGLLGIALLVICTASRAQTIDDVLIGAEGKRPVARIVFNAEVRFLQLSPTTVADLFRVDFEIVAAEEAIANQSTFEAKQVRIGRPATDLTISYSPVPGRRIKQLTLQLQAKLAIQVRQGPDSRSIEVVFPGPPESPPTVPRSREPDKPAAVTAPSTAPLTAAGATTAARIAPASDKRFAISLQTVPMQEKDKLRPIPSRFQDYEAFSISSQVRGVPSYEVILGYFATQEEAETVRVAALDRFPEARVVDLVKRKEETLQSASAIAQASSRQPPVRTTTETAAVAPAKPSPSATPSAPSQAIEPSAPVPPVAPSVTMRAPEPDTTQRKELSEIDRRAREMITRARQSLTAGKFEDAINTLNQLLLLPPNDASQDAQELIGVAWERAGDPARAGVEYQLYLKLFPDGEGAERVTQRLAALTGEALKPGAAPPTSASGAGFKTPSRRLSGSIGQYYYGGISKSQSLVNLAAGIDQSTLSRTTQSAIVTSADLSGRFDSQDAETRVVVRGTGSTNLKSSSHNSSLLSAAYADYKRNESGFAIRAGRQSAIGGGLLGFFDGVSLAYPVKRGLVLDVMGGVPANRLVSTNAERLFAAMLEASGIFERWGGDVYLIDQTSEGITNRRAVGTEVRYSGPSLSAYSLLDYDTNFRTLNAASLQGSLLAPGQTTITILVDDRKAPSLQLTNALISSGATSLKTLLQLQTLAQVRDAALATTASAKQGLLSLSRPIGERWQFSSDVRYSQIGALPAVGNFLATPATGAQYSYSVQLTGSNLYSSRDINGFNLSVITSPFFNGGQLAYNNLTGLRNNQITVEPSVRYYMQHDSQGTKLVRVTPGLRLSYRISERASLLGESIVEHSTTDGPTNHDTTNSVFFYIGYRYGVY